MNIYTIYYRIHCLFIKNKYRPCIIAKPTLSRINNLWVLDDGSIKETSYYLNIAMKNFDYHAKIKWEEYPNYLLQ
jgi:hypothetical protein